MSIIDTARNTEAKISCLLSEGVRTAIRYYNFSNSRGLPEKRMELAEAQALGANGIQIAVVFQQSQDRVEHFTKQKGIQAGRHAYRYAEDNIGQPPGSAIYFAVDFDADNNDVDNNVAPYFEGVKQAFAEQSGDHPEYRVGAYGSGLVCTTLAERGLIELSWLAMSRGFRGTQEALSSGRYHLSQRTPPASLCGLDVDFNDANPERLDFGAFSIEGDSTGGPPLSTAGERYVVVARSGLRLREGPGTQFDIIGGMRFGQVVFVQSITEGWARIDVEGDGRIDGFASAGFLERA